MSISSLDYIIGCLYNSKFNLWIGDNVVKPIVRRDEWHLKSHNQNIQLSYVKDGNFIKAKFHIGLLYVKNIGEAQDYSFDLEQYSSKPSLIGFINVRPLKEDEEVYFHLSYHLNLFAEMNVLDYLNRIYDQIEVIKDDLSFRLGVDLLEDLVEGYEEDDAISNTDKGDDNSPDEEDSFVSPYDIGGN